MHRLFAIGALFAAAGAAHAQTLEAINNCRQLVDGADRVACYDSLKAEPAAAIETKTAEERSCEMVGTLLAGAGNCHDGDIVKIGGVVGADDVPDLVQTYCDFGSQILTLPDKAIASQIAGKPQYVVLCRYHRRTGETGQ
ncbi:exported hypothetical protein [Mesorhizobium sp. ORS 3359]|nr:exported hypothetical protein [Mesorhizobium sp. ORS 3359]